MDNELQRLENENKELKAEIELLKLKITYRDEMIHTLEEKAEELQKECVDILTEAKTYREKYKSLVAQMKDLRDGYQKEMRDYLDRLK